jgi:hypothetical protein
MKIRCPPIASAVRGRRSAVRRSHPLSVDRIRCPRAKIRCSRTKIRCPPIASAVRRSRRCPRARPWLSVLFQSLSADGIRCPPIVSAARRPHPLSVDRIRCPPIPSAVRESALATLGARGGLEAAREVQLHEHPSLATHQARRLVRLGAGEGAKRRAAAARQLILESLAHQREHFAAAGRSRRRTPTPRPPRRGRRVRRARCSAAGPA